jgi:hypothetical protein
MPVQEFFTKREEKTPDGERKRARPVPGNFANYYR